jgi:hypothetical protein
MQQCAGLESLREAASHSTKHGARSRPDYIARPESPQALNPGPCLVNLAVPTAAPRPQITRRGDRFMSSMWVAVHSSLDVMVENERCACGTVCPADLMQMKVGALGSLCSQHRPHAALMRLFGKGCLHPGDDLRVFC